MLLFFHSDRGSAGSVKRIDSLDGFGCDDSFQALWDSNFVELGHPD